MTINEFHRKYRRVTESSHGPEYTRCMVPYVVCKDGFSMSVQASRAHYSAPKDIVDNYTEFEIGFPSAPEPLIAKYAEDWEVEGDDDPRLCETVYGYVPVKTIDLLIKKHGGIDEDAVTKKMEKVA